jgi:hypothetical protein
MKYHSAPALYNAAQRRARPTMFDPKQHIL